MGRSGVGSELVLSQRTRFIGWDKAREVQNYIGLKVKISGTLENKNNMIHVQSVEPVGK